MMESTKEMEPSVTINQEEIPRSKFFRIVEKLSKVADIVYATNTFLIPSLSPLEEQYPKVFAIMSVQGFLGSIAIFIFVVHEFLLLKNGFYEQQFYRKPKRCSKNICSRCVASIRHPKWFKMKHVLLCLGTFSSGVYSLVKIDIFFKTDQNIHLSRLIRLFFWQLNAVVDFLLFTYYGDQLEAHSVSLDVNDSSFEKEPLLGHEMV
ncbi:uncharacterized protein SKDI_09G0805 [Saccharomyces kudriavzevii IFO 1802]|uniref:SKDI09G0805 protein n=2 Tax=Saccharomyces kudriavzevii (strain ATCC MYA-4449 / AS 2.2408 / CBS 8840 / NBRC 1802 / NCYC 2889) TaxID=226230 RepID=A0AA35JKF6_SACK1|nr:uncharacterized protein SKDI_09G0805 [Saccharomyces kudriavzevii IFO 1802]EJT41734.1 YIL089W-like protein [Saccharomyces kudriavzevii IFO 1802]CAI4064574.1 SKDI09G0805 [Saccharomyces kudriavzevii IFO 1802]